MSFILLPVRAKGLIGSLRRVRSITDRYGLTRSKIDHALCLFTQTLGQFNCGVGFALPAIVLKRNKDVIVKHLDQNVEFLVHGYTHIDYSQLVLEEQLTHLYNALEIFDQAGVTTVGFRSPYLRRDPDLYTAIEAVGFSYVSNQPIVWDVLDKGSFTPSIYANYERAIDFYDPWYANERLSLPLLYNQLVEIPVSLPDDEILIDRMHSETGSLVKEAWQHILSQTYQRGELFTIQLHPERIASCVDGLSTVLTDARRFTPPVWIARPAEIAAWWRDRSTTTVQITDVEEKKIKLVVAGPSETTVLARSVQVDVATKPWADGYRLVETMTFTASAPCRPFIGVSPDASPSLLDFLRRQGYIIEISERPHRYAYYFDEPNFTPDRERSVVACIEETNDPLIRLDPWPDGAKSALCITGDIEALTIWDYVLRMFGG